MLSASPTVHALAVHHSGVLAQPGPQNHPLRPNTPVVPFGSTTNIASFLDPTVFVLHGERISIATKTYIAPYAKLDATAAFLKIGSNAYIQDHATLVANPNGDPTIPGLVVGDLADIGPGATILGPAVIGTIGTGAKATGIGANAVIDGATIDPGAIVGALARVGPGVTVPSGMYVLPGANVTTQAEATTPSLGKVRPVTANDTSLITADLAQAALLGPGYASVYHGQSATGVSGSAESPTTLPNLYNGALNTVLGASQEPDQPSPRSSPRGEAPSSPSTTGAISSRSMTSGSRTGSSAA